MKRKLIIAWRRVLVWLGFRVWAKMQYNRPKSSVCVFHGLRMKRQGKTDMGAFYYCWKCDRSYHLRSRGNKLVPV